MRRFYTFLLLWTVSFASATNYYVSAQFGNANNDGLSLETPFFNLQTAADLTEPGDTVFIMNGTYTNTGTNNVLKICNWGEEGAWITYTAVDGHRPKLQFNSFDGIGVFGACYVEISGLEIVGSNDVTKLDFAMENRMNLDVPTTRGRGITVGPHNNIYPHHIRLINNKISRCGGSGIHTYLTDYMTIENNEVYQCGWYSSLLESGIHLIQNHDTDTNKGIKNVLRNNYVYANFTYVPGIYSNQFSGGDGILIEDGQHFYNNTDIPRYQGITLIENNIIFNNGGSGINVHRSDNVWISNNTSYKNSTNPSYDTQEISISAANSILVYNNILVPQTNKTAYDCYNCENFAGDYNLIYDTNYFPYLGSNDITGEDPLFMHPSKNPNRANFRLLAGSPGLDAASMENSASHDFFGNKRNELPDLGAIENMHSTTSDCDAGAVFGDNQQTNFVICSASNDATKLPFFNSSTQTQQYAYIITDHNDEIIAIEAADFDFKTTDLGLFFVYGVAYNGVLDIPIGTSLNALNETENCLDISDNHLTIHKENVSRGYIATFDGKFKQDILVDDDIANLILLQQNVSPNISFVYFLMDTAGIVLDITDKGFELEHTGAGTCYIGGAAYTGQLTIQKGIHGYNQPISDDCYAYAFNVITINKESVLPPPPAIAILDGGNVTTLDNNQTNNLCIQADNNTAITFTHRTTSSEQYSYVVTDEMDQILHISADSIIDFSNLACSTCYVGGVSFAGKITAQLGDTLSNIAFSDSVFVLATENIAINRTVLAESQIQTSAGETAISITLVEGAAEREVVQFENSAVSSPQYVYFLTDETGIILYILTTNQFDFAEVADGTYWLTGLNYIGNLLAKIGDKLETTTLVDGCFKLSDNSIQINRTTRIIAVNGAQIAIPSNDSAIKICAGAGQNELIALQHNSDAEEATYKFILTDANNQLLAIIPGDTTNFETAPDGICFIQGVSYSGEIAAKVGNDLNQVPFSTNNYAFSANTIEVTKIAVDGGQLATETGELDLTFCPEDGLSDALLMDYQTTSNKPYALTLIDKDGILLDIIEDTTIHFSDYPAGFYFVRGVSYTGDIYINRGDDQSLIPFSTDCFHHSNSVKVYWGGAENCLLSTAIHELAPHQMAIRLSPNPAIHQLTIDFDLPTNTLEQGHLEIYSRNGQKIHQQTISARGNQHSIQLDVSQYVSGLYLAKIRVGEYWGYQKFVK